MKWIKFNKEEQLGESLKVGTILRIEDHIYSHNENNEQRLERHIRYAIVGDVNECKGTNDEYNEDGITHFTEDFIPEIEKHLQEAQINFDKNNKESFIEAGDRLVECHYCKTENNVTDDIEDWHDGTGIYRIKCKKCERKYNRIFHPNEG